MKLFRALAQQPFALLWTGQTISAVGDRLFQVALAWWVLEETGSATAMGTVLALTTAPMLVFVLIGGVLVDRLPRVWLMWVSDLVRGLAVTAMAMLAYGGALALAHVYVLSLLSGLVEAFSRPAYRAVVPEIVAARDLPSANSLISLSGQLSGIAGPALGAAVVGLGGTRLAFALNGVSLLVAALCLVPALRLARVPQAAEAALGLLSNLRQGIHAVAALPWLWVTIAVAGLSNIAYAGPMEVSLPFLIEQRWGADVGILGLFNSAASVGALLAALWLGRQGRIRRRGLLLYGSWFCIGILVMLIGLPIALTGLLLASVIMGICNSVLSLVWVNTLQEFVPGNLLGRVTSVDYLGSYLLLPLGFAVGGWATDRFGPSLVVVVGGALQAALVATGLLHRAIRSLD